MWTKERPWIAVVGGCLLTAFAVADMLFLFGPSTPERFASVGRAMGLGALGGYGLLAIVVGCMAGLGVMGVRMIVEKRPARSHIYAPVGSVVVLLGDPDHLLRNSGPNPLGYVLIVLAMSALLGLSLFWLQRLNKGPRAQELKDA